MPVRYNETIIIGGGGGGGPNPVDDFSIGIRITDTIPAANDTLAVSFTFPDTIPAINDAVSLRLVFDDVVNAVTDSLLRLGITITDVIPIANDAATFAVGLVLADTVPTINDSLLRLGITVADIIPAISDNLLQLGIRISDVVPAINDNLLQLRINIGDVLNAPTDAAELAFTFTDTIPIANDTHSALGRAWLSASAGTGVTTPANADGPNNGTNAVISTAVAGATTETLTSSVGVGLPTNLVLPATAIYRGWFSYTETLSTSSGQLLLRSTGALFADKVMLAIAANTDHSGGTFTYDLIANGVNTVALLRSCTVLHSTTDAAAGVTPAVMNVDAGTIEITAFL